MKTEPAPYPVGGIVLAAGHSTRMGRPKPLLEAGGESFLSACIGTLLDAGCEPVVAVVAGGDEAAEAREAGARVVTNAAEDAEQVDSLRVGLGALDRESMQQCIAAVVLPVDHPLVSAATVTALLRAGADQPGAVVRPLYQDRPGHPTVFPRTVWSRFRDEALPEGARTVVEQAEHVLDVPVKDAGVVADIDTPEDYRRHFDEEP